MTQAIRAGRRFARPRLSHWHRATTGPVELVETNNTEKESHKPGAWPGAISGRGTAQSTVAPAVYAAGHDIPKPLAAK